MPSFHAYPALLRAFWARALQERIQVVIWVLTGTYPLVMMAVWIKLAQQNGGDIRGFAVSDFIGYYLGVVWLRRITHVWVLSDYEQPIRSGELSPLLLRPLHYMHQVFAQIVAIRFLNLLIAGAIVAVVAILSPGQQFDLRLGNLLLFGLAIAIGFVFEFLLQSIVGSFAFWTTQVYRIFDSIFFFKSFLGGMVVPLTLLPQAVQDVAYWLPFRSSMALPVEILTGKIALVNAAQGLAIGAAWVLLLLFITRWIWARGVRAYGAVGA
jgi:ABC-2 type transport system permease protein